MNPLHSMPADRLLEQSAWLERLVRRLVADADRAEDVAQDAWLAAVTHAGSVGMLRPWLARVARTLASRLRRRGLRREELERQAAKPEAQPSTADVLERVQIQHRVLAALLKLPEPYRTTVMLRYFEDLPPRKVAQRMQVPVETMRTRLRRALARLRLELDGEFGGRSAWLLPVLTQQWPGRTAAFACLTGILMKTKLLFAAGFLLLAAGVAWFVQPGPNSPLAPPRAPSAEQGAGAATQHLPAEAHRSAEGRVAISPGEPQGESAAPRSEASLVVVTRDPAGAPIPDWVVLVMPAAGEALPERTIRLRTEASGRVEQALAAGSYVLHSFGARGSHPVVLEPGGTKTVELALELPMELQVAVLDPAQQPVPFARILLRWAAIWDEVPVEVGRADAAGRFQLRATADSIWAISATADGYRASPEQMLHAGLHELELLLGAEPAVLDLFVTRHDGTPATGSWTRVSSGTTGVRTDRPIPRIEATWREGSCDRDGHVRFADLWGGGTRLVIRDADHALRMESFDLPAGTQTVRHIRLQQGATLTGVVRAETGEPVAGATIGARELLKTRSGTDGAYRLSSLDPATSSIGLTHPDYENATTTLAAAAERQFTWDPVLRRKGRIRGRLVDAADAPLAGYRILARDAEGTGRWIPGSVMTDSEGRFDLRPDRRSTFTLLVMAPGEKTPFVPDGGADVQAGDGQILLRVTAAHRPTAWVHGSLRVPPELLDSKLTLQFEQIASRGAGWTHVTRIAETGTGRFRHGPMPAGEYRALVTGDSPKLAQHELIRFTLVAGEERDLGELRLGALGRLEITVTMREGRLTEPPSVQLDQLDSGIGHNAGRCEDSGTLVLLAAPGRYRVQVFGTGFLWPQREITLEAGTTERCSFTLEPAARRSIHFVLPDGEQSCTCEIRRHDGTLIFEWEVARDGLGEPNPMPFFAIGRYELRAVGASGRMYAQAFVVDSLAPDAQGIRIEPQPLR